MFVSLLQLMGFPAGKPVHSRATEKNAVRETLPKAPAPEEQHVRRSVVKTPVSKAKKSTAKPVAASKTAKPAKVTEAAKPVAGAVQAGAKSTSKPKAQASAKPMTKPVTGKEAVKATVAKVVRTSTKPAAAEKTAPTARKVLAKAEPVASTPPISKKKPVSVTRVVEPQNSVSPSAKSPKRLSGVSKEDAVKTVNPKVSPSQDVPVRSGRVSARLAQLTVPSMAQSVASTAPKASFTQMTALQPIVSPSASAIKKDPKLANNWKKKPVEQLTDEEIIAMSDDDYMNDTQMAFFRLKLLTLRKNMLSNAGETTEHLREDTVVVPDPADRATIEEEHALELRTRDRERKLLKKIEQSIKRIDAGDYGYCDETGEPIGVARLLARPTATLSLEAQQRRELKQKMFGD